jgi:hypothetical protein
MRQYKFMALVTLDSAAPGKPTRQYPSGSRSLIVRCSRPGMPGLQRYFPAAIYRADGQPLKPGDASVVVTVEIADDQACAFLGPGQHITLWNGSACGHSIISRRVFFTWAA